MAPCDENHAFPKGDIPNTKSFKTMETMYFLKVENWKMLKIKVMHFRNSPKTMGIMHSPFTKPCRIQVIFC